MALKSNFRLHRSMQKKKKYKKHYSPSPPLHAPDAKSAGCRHHLAGVCKDWDFGQDSHCWSQPTGVTFYRDLLQRWSVRLNGVEGAPL